LEVKTDLEQEASFQTMLAAHEIEGEMILLAWVRMESCRSQEHWRLSIGEPMQQRIQEEDGHS
jgi:hypothetical protein